MVWGIAGAIIGAIYLPLGKALGFISYIAVEYILKVTDFLSQAPFAHLEIENMGIFVVVVLYGLIGWWIYLSKKSGG